MSNHNQRSTPVETDIGKPPRNRTPLPKRLAIFLIPLALAAAWMIGALRMQADLEPFLLEALPGANILKPAGVGSYAGYRGEQLIGYARIETTHGYGGPLTAAVGIDPNGTILGLSIISHKETPSYFKKILSQKIPDQLIGKSAHAALETGVDVDGVTGATLSTRAVVDGARRGSRILAQKQLRLEVPPEPAVPFRFGCAEGVLVLLLLTGLAGAYGNIPHKQHLRRVTGIASLVFIGFVYSTPLTLANINSLLLGYFPDFRNHLIWYLLIFGALLPVILTGRDPYCGYVCPFGAVQDCLSAIGGKPRAIKGEARKWLRRFHGLLVFGAVFIALLYRSPGKTSYEVFGSLFDLTGTTLQFAVLGVVLIASLAVARPWCGYLCPIRGVVRFIRRVCGRQGLLNRHRSSREPEYGRIDTPGA